MTLADKQKLLRQSETATKMASQPQLQPTLGGGMNSSKTMGSLSKDLTSTLTSNLNQLQSHQQVSFHLNNYFNFHVCLYIRFHLCV